MVPFKKTILKAFHILKNYKLPFYFVDCSSLQKSENQARQWRYKAFEEIKKKGKFHFVLTGHTLTDKVETVLFHLCRGTGLKGIHTLKTIQTFEMGYFQPRDQTNPIGFKYQRITCSDVKKNRRMYFLLKAYSKLPFYEAIHSYLFYCYTLKKKMYFSNVFKMNTNKKIQKKTTHFFTRLLS